MIPCTTTTSAVQRCTQWCSGSGATGAIAPVPIFQGGATLQFLFLLFLVIFALILQKLKLDLVNYLVICMLCIKSCISYVNVCMDTSIVRMALVLILNCMESVGIYILARYHMIMSKIDIITITFSLKLSFFKHTCVYLNFKHIRNCMPYMFLKFFRLKEFILVLFQQKKGGEFPLAEWIYLNFLSKHSLKHM